MAQQQWPSREEEILVFWERERIFEQSVARDPDPAKGDFVFYDGPPTANAPPGMHHAEPQTYKDVIPRYRTMRGYRVRRKAGWDTHGLPVELQIEKKLGLKTKRDVEAYGIAPFNAACRDSVWEFKADWERLKHRMGSWMDMRDPYVTYEMPFIESVWWFLKQAWEKGLLARDYRSVWYCPRCQTPLSSHEVALGYKDDVEDPAVVVKFQIPNSKFQIPTEGRTYFLAWTTTPWTLPGNVALAVHPDVEYAVVRHGSEHLILAKALVERVLGDGAEIAQTIRGADLIGTRYEPLYAFSISPPPGGGGARGGGDSKKMYTVLPADFVSLEDGTGIVHIAPAYGGEDFDLGKAHGIPPFFTVQQNGTVMEGFPGAGKFFKHADADVRADLTARGLLFRDETIRHTYPFCWRCDTPLLAYARSSWYITMSKLRNEIQARNATINWLPEHIKEGRFGEWLRELKDWAITRERYWGAPVPIWECDRCGAREILSSFAELIAKAPKRNRFILMRHGEAESNARGVISSKLETSGQYPLTEAGRLRVTKAAQQLKSAGVTRIIASPFHRMQQTADIVSAVVGVPVTYDERLSEIDLPDFDGKPEAEHTKLFSPDATQRTIEYFTKKVGQNETWGELAARMLSALRDIDAQHEGETILICSHGDPLFLLPWAYSGRTRAGIDAMPYPDFDNPHPFEFSGGLVNDRGELDAHRPFIDAVTWPCAKDGCSGTMKRFPEVVDVWLESGCMPFAQSHYPFEADSQQSTAASPHPPTPPLPQGGGERKNNFSPSHREGEREGVGSQASGVSGQVSPPALYPADYISEAIDQTRGWFYTLLAVATVLGWDAPYKNVVVLGHLLDAEGQKMSKSRGNIVKPLELIDRYGADVVRWYMVAVNQAWDPKVFNEADLKSMSNKPFGTLRNLLSFWELHGGSATPHWESRNLLDAWLRARVRQTYDAATKHLDAFELTDAARVIGELVDDVSTWWLRRSRERLKEGDADARATFTAALHSLAILIAPIAPFHAEHLWQAINNVSPSSTRPDRSVGGGERLPASGGRGGAASVHLAPWDSAAPPSDEGDVALLQQMSEVRRLCSLGLEARAQANIPVRQPLAMLRIPSIFSPSSRGGARGGADAASAALLQLIASEVNVRDVGVDPSLKDAVSLDTALTPELKREGMVRELTRAVNNLRKEMGLTPTDRIRVTYETHDPELTQAITEQQAQLERAVVAVNFSPSSRGGARGGAIQQTTLTIASAEITLDIAPEAR